MPNSTNASVATFPAFKEWSIICDLIGRGAQSVILRKGGIAEGRGGFHFKEREFYLFPTLFHEQIARTRLDPCTPLPSADLSEAEHVAIRFFVQVDFDLQITDPELLPRLEPFHFWSSEVVNERFNWGKERSIKVAFVRAFRLEPVWHLENRPEFGGCKSWIDLPAPPAEQRLVPVLDDEQHAARRREIEATGLFKR